jgi:DNA-binding GntR family transcriptional regulator
VAETLSGPLPPYVQIANILRDEISAGVYTSEGKLPTSRELIKRFGVTSQPVNNAIRILRDEGLVTTSQRGAFLSQDEAPNERTHPNGGDLSETVAALAKRVEELEARMSAMERSE